MKKTKRYIINSEYSAIVEIEDIIVTISIEKTCKFWGIFNITENVEMVAFELTNIEKDDGRSCNHRPVFHCFTYYKYIPTFNLKLEIDKLYQSYIKRCSDALKQAKLIDTIINQLD